MVVGAVLGLQRLSAFGCARWLLENGPRLQEAERNANSRQISLAADARLGFGNPLHATNLQLKIWEQEEKLVWAQAQ